MSEPRPGLPDGCGFWLGTADVVLVTFLFFIPLRLPTFPPTQYPVHPRNR